MKDTSAGLCSRLSDTICVAFPSRGHKKIRKLSPRAGFAVSADRKAQSPARTASANSNYGSMVLHIVQIQFIAVRGAECVPTHTAEKRRGSYSGVRLEEQRRGCCTSPPVSTIGEQIYNISNRDEKDVRFPLTEGPTRNTKRFKTRKHL